MTLHILRFFTVLVFTTFFYNSNKNINKTQNSPIEKTLQLSDSTSSTKSLKIASWNIRDLGRTKDDQEIHQIANILRDFDLVAIQEVVGKDPAGAQAVAKIVDELNRMGFKWDYRISDPTKSPSAFISERYAFLWKTSKVQLKGRAYLDSELEDKCFREPYIGKFQLKKGATPFYVINFHSRKFDDHPEQEIVFLKEYPARLDSDHILILGDFNLNEKHDVWDNLYNIGFQSALNDTKTTLKTVCKNGDYLNYPIDNIYYSKGITATRSNAIDFVGDCDHLEAARTLSDHLPIYLECKMN